MNAARPSLAVPTSELPMEALQECLMCRSRPERWRPFETLAGRCLSIRYVRCQACGLVFQNPRPSPSSLSDYYSASYRLEVQGQEKPTAKDRWAQAKRAHHMLQSVRPLIRRVENHLDIGSSLGEMLEAFRKEYSCRGVGVEPGREYRRQSEAGGLRVYGDLAALPSEARRTFDLVTMAHVLEHLPDPLSYLREVREKWMRTEGRLVVEVPNLLWHPSLEASHLTAYDERSLVALLEEAGFRAVMIKAHGRPHSRLLPLFILVAAEVKAGSATEVRGVHPLRGLRLRRSVGRWFLRSARAVGLLLLGRRRLSPWED